MKSIVTGVTFELHQVVTPDMSAARVGSGLLDVFSTPAMIALMEKTAFQCLEQFLDSHESSVGGEVNIRHMKPTAIGEKVSCRATITLASGKRVVFDVDVYENEILIGKGTHTRFVIDKESFAKSISGS